MAGLINAQMGQTLLAIDTVRYVGEPVAAVVTDAHYQGPDAAELVDVDYDPLAVVVEAAAAAMRSCSTRRWGQTSAPRSAPRPGADWSRCDVVVGPVSSTSAWLPAHSRCGRRRRGGRTDGRLTHWASTQGPHPVRDHLAAIYGLDPVRSGSSRPTSAAASAPRSTTPRSCCALGWPTGSAHRSAGPRPAARAWWASDTAGPRSRTSRSAGPRRPGSGLPARCGAGRRGLPPLRLVPAPDDPLHAHRHLRHPRCSDRVPLGRDQHRAGRGLPGRGPARGGRRDRTVHRPLRPRDRHGSRRGEASQPDPARRLPVHHPDGDDLRLGPLPPRPGPGHSATSATTSSEGSRSDGARRAIDGCSESGWPPTSRSPQAVAAGSTARWRSFRRGGSGSSPARRRTDRATRPRGRCSSPTASAWPSTRSTCCMEIPMSCPEADSRADPDPCRSAAPTSGGPPAWLSSGGGSWPPTCWRPTRPTWCSTGPRAASMWPGRRASPCRGAGWPRRPPPRAARCRVKGTSWPRAVLFPWGPSGRGRDRHRDRKGDAAAAGRR